MEKIIVLDFGSQYSHLICRRIRDFSVYAELVPYDISPEELKKMNPKELFFQEGHQVSIMKMHQNQMKNYSILVCHY